MTVKIGIIGTGWISGKHLDALRKIKNAEVVAIAGRNRTQAEALASQHGAKAYGDFKEMLLKERLDAAFILLPPDVHGEVELECAKHVGALMIEKPVSNNLKQAQALQKEFKKAGTFAVAGYMNRYREGVRRAKQLFDESADKPVLVNGWWVCQMPPVAWWMDASRSGGQFLEQCTHLVDLSRHIVGEIAEVQSFSARGFINGVAGYDADDAMTVNVKFSSGAIGNFVTGAFPLNGTDARRAIGLTISSRTRKCEFSGWGMELEASWGKDHVEIVKPEDDVFELQDRAFVEAVEKGDHSLALSSYEDAARSLAVGIAANESAKSGSAVRLT
jgi:myo-inositol 2-dehydrogenase / D-chiro-inositol 1-dehydrogenase